jgi:hypothetical protein
MIPYYRLDLSTASAGPVLALQHGLTVDTAVIRPHTHGHLKVRAERPRTYNRTIGVLSILGPWFHLWTAAQSRAGSGESMRNFPSTFP